MLGHSGHLTSAIFVMPSQGSDLIMVVRLLVVLIEYSTCRVSSSTVAWRKEDEESLRMRSGDFGRPPRELSCPRDGSLTICITGLRPRLEVESVGRIRCSMEVELEDAEKPCGAVHEKMRENALPRL